ncbi:UNVERIFIED_ORG: hypothetical protein BCL66_107194 [Martelella mediterranea]
MRVDMGCGVIVGGMVSFSQRWASFFRHAGLEPASRATRTKPKWDDGQSRKLLSGCPGPRLKAGVTAYAHIIPDRSVA